MSGRSLDPFITRFSFDYWKKEKKKLPFHLNPFINYHILPHIVRFGMGKTKGKFADVTTCILNCCINERLMET